MQRFGTLSFGHYGPLGGGRELTAADSLHQAIDLAQGMDDLGVNGAYFRVHHFARQQASPMPLLAAIAARTKHIEVGTGVIDMRYENPLYLAEEAAAVDLISDGRLALGVSRGSPESVVRGYEAFGYTGSTDPRGADIAREHFDTFLRAIEGEGIAERDSQSPFGGGSGKQRIQPHHHTGGRTLVFGLKRLQIAAKLQVRLEIAVVSTQQRHPAVTLKAIQQAIAQ